MERWVLALALMIVPAGTVCAETDVHNVFGLWVSAAGDGHIAVKDCGDGTPCGTLVWVDPSSTDTHLDARNPDPELRSRPLIGTPIIWGFSAGKRRWQGGRIYNPEDGTSFRSTLKRRVDGTLEVRGCLGPICRTNIWTPASLNSKKDHAND